MVAGREAILLKEQIKRINKLIAKAERLCLETVRKNDSTNKLCERFTQVGGVGAITAISILAGLPEIGTLSDEKLNRLVGISPEEDQSGSRDRLRRIWGAKRIHQRYEENSFDRPLSFLGS